MKRLRIIGAAVFLSLTAPAWAHRLDEYLQATILSVERDHVAGFMRLVPGVAVSASVIPSIDTNGDGTLSEAERRAYALRVLSDLSLSVDGQHLATNLISAEFPSLDEMRRGIGEIQLEFTAALPRGGTNRKLIFENRHESRIAAYLVNCLVPSDKGIRITAQDRNHSQSFYQLEFAQLDAIAALPPAQHAFFQSLSGFGGAFRLGLQHIAEGGDHLLFLLALLLPAPLLACGSRWGRCASVRHSLLQIVKIVTAFTLGHSLTLALAALGLVHVPSRPIEVLIAVSVLVSAVHAMRPLFPGREAVIAAFFGLIHGLAFATALGKLGFDRGYQLVSILGFNIGIESMQLIVVAATMPSLLTLSRIRAYSLLRIGGAFFATLASVGWIVERVLDVQNVIDPLVQIAAHHAAWIAATLLLISLLSWLLRKLPAEACTAAEARRNELQLRGKYVRSYLPTQAQEPHDSRTVSAAF
jgi:hypothetical protein